MARYKWANKAPCLTGLATNSSTTNMPKQHGGREVRSAAMARLTERYIDGRRSRGTRSACKKGQRNKKSRRPHHTSASRLLADLQSLSEGRVCGNQRRASDRGAMHAHQKCVVPAPWCRYRARAACRGGELNSSGRMLLPRVQRVVYHVWPKKHTPSSPIVFSTTQRQGWQCRWVSAVQHAWLRLY